ncbi:hypothetical protein C1646_760871 [Rhizophagus diaphanus]|nr:hypothetical protein C1646_760871 [Rhizophagus diaphanus] [Rhizophagus sp. MUCL 43196]
MSFRKHVNKANAITIYTRVKEHPDFSSNKNKKNQQSLETTLLAAKSKREVVESLIQAFANANIPL